MINLSIHCGSKIFLYYFEAWTVRDCKNYEKQLVKTTQELYVTARDYDEKLLE